MVDKLWDHKQYPIPYARTARFQKSFLVYALRTYQLAITTSDIYIDVFTVNYNNNNNIAAISSDDKEGQFLYQRLSIALQRFNAILLHESFVSDVDPHL